ncbi:MAG: TRAM domain-containing protein, partial [Sphingomonadales bacterium]|nr:TRAM domain-containing protein [Sphingomonadales bacterium]
LKKMNRKYTIETYLAKVEALQKICSGIAITTDIIVGFPGETDEDFEATMQFIKDVTFIQAYSFKYSPRPGTPAALMENQIPEAVKAERLARLQALINEQVLAFNLASVGKTYSVLFDRIGKEPGQLVGRSPYTQAVVIEGDESLLHTIQDVVITSAAKTSLKGKLVGAAKRACA